MINIDTGKFAAAATGASGFGRPAARPARRRRPIVAGGKLLIPSVVVACCLAFIAARLNPAEDEASRRPATVPFPDGSRRCATRRDDDGDGDDDDGNAENAASYARFSSELQRADSTSSQHHQCSERAAQNGHRIPQRFRFSDEAVSGTKLEREQLNAMLAAAGNGEFGVLYLYSLSRLARESVITMPILKRLVYVDKVRVISVSERLDSDQMGWELLATVLSIVSEQYIKDLRQNVLRGQEAALRAGYSLGDYCFGYTSVPVRDTERDRRGRGTKPRKVYALDPEKGVWVMRIFHWFVEERRPLRWIARELNRLGAPKDHRATTADWQHQYVARLLQNEKYIGVWSWGRKTNVRNPLTGQLRQEDRPEHEQEKWIRRLPELQLVEDETFHRAQELLKENRDRYAGNRSKGGRLRGSRSGSSGGHPRHLLSGLIQCAACGARFYVGGTQGKYLFCPNYPKGLCSCRTKLRRDRAERMILDEIGRRALADPAWRGRVREETLKAWKAQDEGLPAERAAAEKRLAEVEQKISRLIDRVEIGGDEPEISRRIAGRRAEAQELRRLVRRLGSADAGRGPAPTVEWIDQELRRLGETLQSGEPAAAHALRALVDGRVVVEEIRKEGRQRHHLRGRFRVRAASVTETSAGVGIASPARGDAEERSEEIVIDFVDYDRFTERADKAKELLDEGLLCREIAARLGCKRSYVTKLLKAWHVSRGLTPPDGRGRRWSLAHEANVQPYQRIAEQVKKLADQDLLLGEIAERLGVDRNTVTKSLKYWHEKRGLEPPDGRARRKSLSRKPPRADEGPPEADASAA